MLTLSKIKFELDIFQILWPPQNILILIEAFNDRVHKFMAFLKVKNPLKYEFCKKSLIWKKSEPKVVRVASFRGDFLQNPYFNKFVKNHLCTPDVTFGFCLLIMQV